MAKIYQLVIEGQNQNDIDSVCEDIKNFMKERYNQTADDNVFETDEASNIELTEIQDKLMYTKEDKDLFSLTLSVRIKKEHTELVTNFKKNFVFMYDVKVNTAENEDNPYFVFKPKGGFNMNLISVLMSQVKDFVSEMQNKEIAGSVDAKINVYPNVNVPIEDPEEDEIGQRKQEAVKRLVKSHVKFLVWTEITPETEI